MIGSKEKLILLHLNLATQPIELEKIRNRFQLDNAELLGSLEKINAFLVHQPAPTLQCIKENDTIYLTNTANLDQTSWYFLNLKNVITNEELATIVLDTLLKNCGVLEIALFLKQWNISHERFSAVVTDFKRLMKLNYLNIITDGPDFFKIAPLSETQQKRLKLLFLTNVLQKVPSAIFLNFEDFVPVHLQAIFKNWLQYDLVVEIYRKLDFVLTNQNLARNFWTTLEVTLIFILWRDCQNNAELLTLDKNQFHLTIDQYVLEPPEKEVVQKYCQKGQLACKNFQTVADFTALTQLIKSIYQPLTIKRLESLQTVILELLDHSGNCVPKISVYKQQTVWKKETNFILERVKLCIPNYPSEIQTQIAFSIFYWLLEQTLLDPLTICFLPNGKSPKTDYYMHLVSNSFCCAEFKTCTIFDLDKYLNQEKTVILTDFVSIVKQSPKIIPLNNVHLGESQDLIEQICFKLLKEKVEKFNLLQ